MSDKDQNINNQNTGHEDTHTSNDLINKEGYFYKMTYGAPELKQFYRKFATRGMIIAIALHLIIIGAYVFTVILETKADERRELLTNIIQLEDLETPPAADEDMEPPPDIEVPEEIVLLKDLEALIPEPVARQEAEILTTKTQEALEEIHAPVASTGDENAPNVGIIGRIEQKRVEERIERKEERQVDQNRVFQQFEVEKQPSPVNLAAIRSSMRYPEIARSNGIEGRVTVTVVVGTGGSIERIVNVSGPDVFHSEVRSKVMGLQFTPALQNGKPVRCRVSVPFSFTLSGQFQRRSDDTKKDESSGTTKTEETTSSSGDDEE